MRSLLDMISVAIFGPPTVVEPAPRISTVGYDHDVSKKYRELCWVGYWRGLGVDDPVAAARVCTTPGVRFSAATRETGASVEASRAGFHAGALGVSWVHQPVAMATAHRADQEVRIAAMSAGCRPEELTAVPDLEARENRWLVKRKRDGTVVRQYYIK